ncbi:hypothetical protein FN846DRAFT_938964 [Sphaerosporella brunnea]|uniref:Fermentation associated protein n=1 Tax=Sphaerosporella brunnea TaxID=1250544 RepID=A0A5J5F3L5_9PEZI|nr:hypothetical protein FN846DRAFT_938964 [Sphaerosporella brunnea]
MALTVFSIQSRSIDKYKQVFELSFTHPVVQMKPNDNFKEPLLSRGAREQTASTQPAASTPAPPVRTRRQKLHDLIPFLTPSVESFTPANAPEHGQENLQSRRGQWMGLSRYLDDPEQQDGWKFEPEEYAMVTTILDCESATFCLYWDVIGTVPTCEPAPFQGGKNRNGTHLAPEFGIDLSFAGGTVNYGPWADRQRVHLQQMFFPRIFKTSVPAEPLRPGDDRVYTEFKIFVELSKSTILRIPAREASKDWKYRRRLEEGEVRPSGWLEIKVGDESTVSYNMSYASSLSGWAHTLDLELRTPEVRTSVNHGLLWSAERQTLQCDLSGPLQWNGDTKWIFNNVSTGMKIFLLREHVMLLADLATDWTSGPPSEYWTFIPMIYELNVELKDSEFFLNVNDQNIINNPSSFDDNTFIVLRNMGGDKGHLRACVTMDFREFRPQSSTVAFTVENVNIEEKGGLVEVGVRMPGWNTWNSSLKQPESLGKVAQIKLKGSYEFYADTTPSLIDTLSLDIDGQGLDLVLHGVLIRYFLTIKENYFGENLHFKTLEEWQEQQNSIATGGPSSPAPPHSKSNDLDVVLSVAAREIAILLPKHIYDAKEHLRLSVPTLGLDMRFTNYYMDLQVDVAPISVFLGGSNSPLPEMFVDGLTIFGHRLFGLPPAEPTYVCNWDLNVGDVTGEASPEFLQTAIFAIDSFVFSFKDVENALPGLALAIIHDVTFVRLNVGSIRLWLEMHSSSVFRLAADEVSFVLNDLADEIHSDRITLKIPGLNVACMDRQRRDGWNTKGYLGTNVDVTVLGRKNNASVLRRLQQKHVRDSDYRTGRANFLLANEDYESTGSSIHRDLKSASMALPALPSPRYDAVGSAYDSHFAESDMSSKRTGPSVLKSSQSFLSRSRVTASTTSLLRSTSSHAPSFHSAVESFSDIPMFTSGTRSLNPSGSQSAAAPGSRGSMRATTSTAKSIRHTSFEVRSRSFAVNLSSTFARPKYPLDDIEPDLSKVPELENFEDHDLSQSADPGDFPPDEESSRDSIIVQFLPGIRAYCTPTAVKEFASLLENIQPQTPDDFLDSIQVKVVSKLAEVVKKANPHGTILEACVRLPQLKFCFVDDFAASGHKETPDEQGYGLYFNLRNLLLAGRSKKEVKVDETRMTASETLKSILSIHVVVDSVDLGLKNLVPPLPGLQMSAQPALALWVEGLRFWASTSETLSATLQLKTLASSAQGSQALFTYDVAQRMAVIGEEIASKFSTLSIVKERRVRQFISGLAIAGEDFRITQDPPTLTRPSYVLRSATEHVRLNDSWKISTRLRHIWQLLPPTEKKKWNAECVNRNSPQSNAKDTLIHVLQRWRGWELGNIKESVLIKEVFGEDHVSVALDAATHRAVKIKFVIGSIRLLLDPGPTQHEFIIDQLHGSVVTGTSTDLANSVGGTAAVVAPGVHANTAVEVHTRSIRLGIRWEILDILEAVAKGLQHRHCDSPTSAGPPSPTLSHTAKPKQSSGGLHLIFTTDHGSITLDTVNLRIVSMVQDVKASVVLAEQDIDLQVGKFGNVGSLLFKADYGSSEICFGNKILSKATIRAPSLYGHFDEHWFAETKFHIWKVMGSSEEIIVDIQEQVLGLMEVVDYVVTDEFAHVHRLLDTIDGANPMDNPPGSPSLGPSKRQVHSIHCTLSLDRFSITARLLPSLAYLLRGGGGRLSARPNSKDSKEMIINFGLEHHEHEICKSTEPSESRIISLLRLPAINVGLRDQNSDEERFVEATVSVEAITLDASSIQSLLNAFKKPELLKVIEGARLEWQGINSKLEEIFGHQEKPKASTKPAKPLLYRAHAGVSGLKIETLSPSANLEINLGFIQLHASNRGAPKEPVLPFPDIRLEFGRITVELTRTAPDGVRDTCGFIEWHASLQTSLQHTVSGQTRPAFYIQSHSLRVDIFAETASAVVDIVGHLQDKLRDLDLSREVKYFRKLRHHRPLVRRSPALDQDNQFKLSNMAISIELRGIQVFWVVGLGDSLLPLPYGYQKQNLVLSFKRIHFSTATRKSNEAELIIEEFLLQMVDASGNHIIGRSENSALMPEVMFKVAYSINPSERRLAFQAKGRSLDLRLTSSCVMAANSIQASITAAVQKFRDASSSWKSTPTKSGGERTSMFSSKRLASVLVDADFAGAVVHLSRGSMEGASQSTLPGAQQGRYGQFSQSEAHGVTMLKSPGLAFKVEYTDPVNEDPSLSAEIKISASDNTLYPSVVPLILEMSDNVKEVMKQPPDAKEVVEKTGKSAKGKDHEEPHSEASIPAAILGGCRLNVGIRICKQEFTLSCQPIARVAASAGYDLIYASINTCDDPEGYRFYSASVAIIGLKMSLQHVYSRESTGTLEVEAVTLSLMNSKHVVGSAGLSCMMQLSPIKSQANIKQSQDFLLFREIWYPVELRDDSSAPLNPTGDPSSMLVQRYHKVAATNAFPWNATIAVAGVELQLDLGQSLGKTSLQASKLWVTSRKTSDWEQTMCLGFDSIRVSSVGRLGGYVDLNGMKVRTSINWDSAIESLDIVQTPLVEASIGFNQFQAQLSFDYQAFLLADIAGFDFLMYNLKDPDHGPDRLVGVLDGNEVQIFCTTSSAAQGLALYQAFQRLAQDKLTSFEASLKEIESFLSRRQTHSHTPSIQEPQELPVQKGSPSMQSSLFSLQTDVVVNLKEVHVGAFPSTFHDTSIFKIEALNATARFAVEMVEKQRIHSMLEMTLGQLSVALSPVKYDGLGTTLADVSVGRVINGIAAAKQKLGTRGIILKVPQVTAKMHTWHAPGSMMVDYIFKSAFEGQVDVGWNFQRVAFIKGMYHAHARALAQRQGKAPVNSRISMYTDLTPGSGASSEHGADSVISAASDKGDKKEPEKELEEDKKGKITAVVDVPQSKYEYNPIEPPIIETPQLRDMGEATPPMEWIGLHRERLPHLTHQIVIVSLLEIAREVEDAYAKILGSS